MTRTIYQIADPSTSEVVAEHVRDDHPDGSKRVSWRRPGYPTEDGLAGLRTADLPLYGADRLRSLEVGRTVLLCEGEKATEACWSLGLPAVGTVTGAAGTPGEDALAVLLPFDVVSWPDHDEAGEKHMTRCVAALIRLGGGARRLSWGRDKGDDAADFVSRGGTSGTVDLLVQAATPWRVEMRPQRPPQPRYETLRDDSRIETAKSHLVQVAIEKLGQPLKQEQRSLWWRCPFHQERSASFKVDLREPFFRCFGCEARGDVFTFLRLIEGREFKDALLELAPPTLSGVPVVVARGYA